MNSNTLTKIERFTTLIHYNIKDLSELFFDITNDEADEINAIIAPMYPFHMSANELAFNVDIWRKDVKNKITKERNKLIASIETLKVIDLIATLTENKKIDNVVISLQEVKTPMEAINFLCSTSKDTWECIHKGHTLLIY